MNHFLKALVTDVDSGGFTAVASTPDVDRDGEIVDLGAFNPLPASVAVHRDHKFSIDNLIGRAVPKYAHSRLMIDATFAKHSRAQEVRELMQDGILDTVSVAFHNPTTVRDRDGVVHVTKATLISVDAVTIPSHPGALVVSTRDVTPSSFGDQARRAGLDALLTIARADLIEARGYYTDQRGPARRDIDRLIRAGLNEGPATAIVSDFKRSL